MTRPAVAERTPDAVAGGSRSSFLASFAVLAPPRRAALVAVYAFCRVVDDAVDDARTPDDGATALRFWSDELAAAARGRSTTPIGAGLVAAIRDFGVPVEALEGVVAGMAIDLGTPRLPDAAAFDDYCHKVASCVGLACLPIFGVPPGVGSAYATALGKALQTTNVLRDLVEDATRGRVYVPATWLAEAGVDAAWLRGDGPRDVYRDGGPVASLVVRVAAHARAKFAEANAALPASERERLIAPAVMGAVYEELLTRLERRGGAIAGPRVSVPRWRKLWIAWRTRRAMRATRAPHPTR